MFTADGYFVQLLAWVWLHFAWQGVFIIISSRTCDFVFRKSPAPFRYRVFRVHLAALGVAPLLTLLVSHQAIASGIPLGASGSSGAMGSLFSGLPSLLLPPFHVLVQAMPCVLLFWTVGILIGAGLLVGGRVRCSRLQCVCRTRGRLAEIIVELTQKLRMKAPPAVLEAEVDSPFVVGMGRQRLILPREFEHRLPPEELRAILAHELAHVKRSDYGSNLVQTALVLLLWPHPAGWMIRAQLRHEREACCDEAAVGVCGSALPLARALYRMAVRGQPFGVAVPAAAGPLKRRFERLLNANPPSAPIVLWVAPVFMMMAFAVVTSLLAQTLPADAATRRAFIASPLGPTILVQAVDPAGSFRVQLRGGRVLGVSIGNESIPPDQVMQRGGSVRVLGRSGQELLAMQVDPRGGISWLPRTKRGPSTF